uniref:Protein kinase domain-containing protein n=1 Tax=Panagrolaimus sp. PS1159 TaxID=55785 RepID=A0AC35FDG4_9BILA
MGKQFESEHKRLQMNERSILMMLADRNAKDDENVIRLLHDYIDNGYLHFFFRKYDSNLRQMIQHSGGLTLKEIKCYGLQLLQGVMFLNDNQILHCDLKEDNVMISGQTFKDY